MLAATYVSVQGVFVSSTIFFDSPEQVHERLVAGKEPETSVPTATSESQRKPASMIRSSSTRRVTKVLHPTTTGTRRFTSANVRKMGRLLTGLRTTTVRYLYDDVWSTLRA